VNRRRPIHILRALVTTSLDVEAALAVPSETEQQSALDKRYASGDKDPAWGP